MATASSPAASQNPYLAGLVRQTLVAELVLAVVGFAVSAATDEGGVPLTERLGRVLPLAPVAAALAALLVTRRLRQKGEERALASLGQAPAQLAVVCALAAMALPALAATALAAGRAEVRGFYPTPPAAPVFREGAMGFVSDELGIEVRAGGELVPTAQRAPEAARSPAYARLAASTATLLAGLALALAAARPRASPTLAAVLPSLLAVVVTLLLFQLAAAGRISALFAGAPPLALLTFEVFAYRASAWPSRSPRTPRSPP